VINCQFELFLEVYCISTLSDDKIRKLSICMSQFEII